MDILSQKEAFIYLQVVEREGFRLHLYMQIQHILLLVMVLILVMILIPLS